MRPRAPIPVSIHSVDPYLKAGTLALLQDRPEVCVAATGSHAAVGVVVSDQVDDAALQLTRSLHRSTAQPVVMLISRLDGEGVVSGAEAGAISFIRRTEAEPDRLVAVLQGAARGHANVPSDLVRVLLQRAAGRGSTPAATAEVDHPDGKWVQLSEREVEVLRLAAEGMETADIARTLCYSERTVKSIVHDVTTRLQLRNRTHAVAFAVRTGLI